MKVEILQVTPDADKLIERIGRKCYNSEHGITYNSYVQFIKNLIKRGHDSVLEHGVVTFDISGISRSCSHQLVRHRIASFTQRSQRYCLENDFEYIIPSSISENPGAMTAYETLMFKIEQCYDYLRSENVKPEDARMVLPNACETTLTMTMNFRSLRNFFKLRLDSHAQWEIRALAKEMLKLVYPHAQACFEDFYQKYGVQE